MIASSIRRFSVAAPRMNPPMGSVAKTTSSMSPSSSRRVAMMPGTKQNIPVNASSSSNSSPAGQSTSSSGLEDVLTVGGISSHCDGQKINRASEGSI